MEKFKRLAILICVLAVISAASCPSLAAEIDVSEWNSLEKVYHILSDGSSSNSALELAFLKVKYDRPSNRVRLFFILEFATFTDEAKAGVTLSVNGGEKITLHSDGSAEYNEDKYFAAVKTLSDRRTRNLSMEITLGIKEGLPEKAVLTFNFYDTEGIASNTYTVDITETAATVTSTTTEKATKTNADKTTKNRAQKTDSTTKKQDETTTLQNNTVISKKTAAAEHSFKESNAVGIIIAVAVAAIGIGTSAINILKRSKK